MTPATRAYLLDLTLREKETAAHDLIRSGEETSPAWGAAALAVRELLDETLRQSCTVGENENLDNPRV